MWKQNTKQCARVDVTELKHKHGSTMLPLSLEIWIIFSPIAIFSTDPIEVDISKALTNRYLLFKS